jgi:flagellar motor switch protein FliN/FliY
MADDPSPNPGAEGQDAPLTEEGIDAALNSAGGADASDGGSNGGEFTQADIDAALGGGALAEAAPADEPDQRVDSCGKPLDEAAAAMAAAIEEEKAATAAAEAQPAGQPFELPDLAAAEQEGELSHDIDLLHDVNLQVKIELGRTRMLVEDVLRLGEGSVVELDKLAGDPVDVFANDRLIARGEVLVLNDTFCVRVSEIISGEPA